MNYSVLSLVALLLIIVNNYGTEAYLFEESMDTPKSIITVSSPSGSFSSGILKSSFRSSYITNWNKTLTISAPYGCGITAAIRRLDLRPSNLDYLRLFPPNDIRSAVVFSNPSFIRNNSYDSFERTTVYSSNGQLNVNFQTGPGSSSFYNGFELIFTAYTKGTSCSPYSEFSCWNARCISSSLKCDGHNHCGDRSEQMNCSTPTHKPKRNVAAIVTGIVFVVIAVACIACILIRRSMRSRSETSTTIHPPPLNPSPYPPSYPQPGTCYPPSYPQPGTGYPLPPPPYTQGSQGQTNAGYQ